MGHCFEKALAFANAFSFYFTLSLSVSYFFDPLVLDCAFDLVFLGVSFGVLAIMFAPVVNILFAPIPNGANLTFFLVGDFSIRSESKNSFKSFISSCID